MRCRAKILHKQPHDLRTCGYDLFWSVRLGILRTPFERDVKAIANRVKPAVGIIRHHKEYIVASVVVATVTRAPGSLILERVLQGVDARVESVYLDSILITMSTIFRRLMLHFTKSRLQFCSLVWNTIFALSMRPGTGTFPCGSICRFCQDIPRSFSTYYTLHFLDPSEHR